VSDPGPFGPDDTPDPFGKMPVFGDLVRMLQSQMGGQGPVAWEAARQLALSVTGSMGGEPNVEPSDRIALEDLARVAEMHVVDATGLRTSGGAPLRVEAMNRSQWTMQTMDAYRPLFEKIATAIDQPDASAPDPTSTDPGAFLGPLFQMIAPMRAGMVAGALVGNLAKTAFGSYRLPLPRRGDELSIVVPNVTAFAEAWSLPPDELRMWVLVHEVTSHAVLRVPHIGGRLDELVAQYATSFESDPDVFERRIGELDLSAFDPNALFVSPEMLLGAVESEQQRALQPQIDALVAVVLGAVEHVVTTVGGHLLGTPGSITEAVRRQRSDGDDADQIARPLLGLDLTRAVTDRGTAFVAGVIERAGPEALARLWTEEHALPTPAEVDAPGLWLARLEILDGP
jgi:putative hydrolase